MTLLSFLINNDEYEKLLGQFNTKAIVTASLMSIEDFIKSEIENIALYIEPLQISIGADFKIAAGLNFTEYVKLAYDSLKRGYNLDVEKILTGAKQNYLNSTKSVSYNDEISNNAIITHLKKGVAYLKYERFLKDELKKYINE